MNFPAAARPGYVGAALAIVKAKAHLTLLSRLGARLHQSAADVRDVEIVLALEAPGARGNGPHHTLAVEEGGPTGYERIYVALPGDPYSDHALTVAELSMGGWCACSGTIGRWDRLFIPPESLAPALAELLKAVGK